MEKIIAPVFFAAPTMGRRLPAYALGDSIAEGNGAKCNLFEYHYESKTPVRLPTVSVKPLTGNFVPWAAA